MTTALQVMSRESEALAAPVDYTRQQIDLIKDTYAKGATDAELSLFIEIAKRKGLDIFSKQICLIGRWDSRLGKEVKDPQTTIDGYRLIAERTGRYVPGRETTYQEDGQRLISATAYVKKLVANEWHEIAATAFFDEYKQTKKDGSLNPLWQKMPHVMIAKCAEALALRKAFPAELSGIYTQEEMAGAGVIDTSPRDTVEALSHRITKVEGGYDCEDNGEVHAIRRDERGVFCSCGSVGATECLHRLALKLWIAREKAQPATNGETAAAELSAVVDSNEGPEFENPAHAAAFEMQAPTTDDTEDEHIITKSQLIALANLCKELEAAGISEEQWRDQMEKIAGQRTRKGMLRTDYAKVTHSFKQALEATQKKAASRKGAR